MAVHYAGGPDWNAIKRDRDTFSLDHDSHDSVPHEPRRRYHQAKRARHGNFACELPFLAKSGSELGPDLDPGYATKSDPEFVVLRENGVAVLPAAVDAVEKEQTASGLSIRPEPDPTERCASTELLEDEEAAQRVREHVASFGRRFPDSKHARILRSILQPRPGGGGSEVHHHHHHHHHPDHYQYPLDDDALASLFSAANEVFFNGRLSQRVAWDWSHASSARYDARVIGTTALRRSRRRGFETLIVLSGPILHDRRYSRRLLLSTFLHELIHCYMFVCCGFRARHSGGHTPGFRAIARIVDDWVGAGCGLHLSNMEADLDLFLAPDSRRAGEEVQGKETGRVYNDYCRDEDWRRSPSRSPHRRRPFGYAPAQRPYHDCGPRHPQSNIYPYPCSGHVHEQQEHYQSLSLPPAGPVWRGTRLVHTPLLPGRPAGNGDHCPLIRY